MQDQTRRLLMWAEHAERWEPVCAIAPQPRRRLGFLYTANLPKNTTTVQVDASAYTRKDKKNENHITANRKR